MTRPTPAFRELTWEQKLELLIGPGIGPGWPNDGGTAEFRPERSNFDSEAERREAWEAHRDLIREWCLVGIPWAQERYEPEGR